MWSSGTTGFGYKSHNWNLDWILLDSWVWSDCDMWNAIVLWFIGFGPYLNTFSEPDSQRYWTRKYTWDIICSDENTSNIFLNTWRLLDVLKQTIGYIFVIFGLTFENLILTSLLGTLNPPITKRTLNDQQLVLLHKNLQIATNKMYELTLLCELNTQYWWIDSTWALFWHQ